MRILLLVLSLTACSGSSGSGATTGNIVEIELSPTEVSLTTTSDAPATQQFSVTAHTQSGEVEKNFPLVGWSLSNTAVGSIDDQGLFTAATSAGGRTLLTADVDGLTATADVTVTYEESVVGDGLPADAASAFAGTPTDASGTLTWLYPDDGVALPRNLPEFTFMWNDGVGANLYELTFTSDTTHVTVITDSTTWTAPKDLWDVITATNAGKEVSVSLTAANADLSGGQVGAVSGLYAASDISFRVNRFDAEGAVYYWSIAESAIVRSAVDENNPQVWFGPTNHTTTSCVGCHVINANGDRVAFAWQIGGEDGFRMGLGSIDTDGVPAPLLAMDTDRDNGMFSSFSPDGTRLVFSNGGKLHFYDGDTGDYIGDLDSDLDLTQPSWSPDGKHLVAVSATKMFGSDTGFDGGELVVFTADDSGDFDPVPDTLVPAVNGLNQYYPMYSPDGAWVVFDRAVGSPYFNEQAALWLVSADGGDPIKLENADKAANLTNSWPRWGPIPDDDVLWVAFASTRDYGSQSTDGAAHIWVSAIDTKLAEKGQDPSFPAFFLVQQVVGGDNHAPWWSLY